MANKDKICCLLVRVSTDAQNFDEQKRQLKEMAMADGYKEENIISIEEKESGYKTEEERVGLNTLKEEIEKGCINCVYAWAIDRIGRKSNVIHNIRQLLEDNKINLKIREPNISLIKKNGEIDETAKLIIAMYAQLAEMEMKNRLARFRRTKAANAKLGLFNGGKIHFGYKKNENGKEIIINEEEAEIIKLIFSLYSSGKYSLSTLTEELTNRGYQMRGKPITPHFIKNMLDSTAFQGFTEYKPKDGREKITRLYPQIISKELQNKCKEIARGNFKGDITKQRKRVNYGTKLIVCPECGKNFVCSNRTYRCVYNRNIFGEHQCNNRTEISAEWLDALLWHYSREKEIEFIEQDTKEKKEEYKDIIIINEQKISNYQNYIDRKVNQQLENIEYMFGKADITKERYEQMKLKVKQEKKGYIEKITKLKEENQRLKNILQDTQDPVKKYKKLINLIYNTVSLTDREEIYNIVHNHISKVIVEPTIWKDKKQYQITIFGIDGKESNYLYIPKSKVKNEEGFITKLFTLSKTNEATPLLIEKHKEITEGTQFEDYWLNKFGTLKPSNDIKVIPIEEQ